MKNLINNQKVFIKELHTSKGREKHRSFLIEGEKVIFEAISTRHPITYIVATEELRDVALELATKASCELFITSASIMNSISTMSTPPGILAVASVLETPSQQPCPHTLLLEGISDPGNLGTLLRSAEWFGFESVYISKGSVDLYNPKVVAATMGSLFRLRIVTQCDLVVVANELRQQKFAVVSAVMNGGKTLPTTKKIAVVIGSESHGLSAEMTQVATHTYTLQNFGHGESLNAAVAGSIIMSKIAGV